MNVIIDIHTIAAVGGLERFGLELVRALLLRGHRVYVFVSDLLTEKPVLPVPEGAIVVYQSYKGEERGLAQFKEQIFACNPDVCICLDTAFGFNLWNAALRGTQIPWVYSEHAQPDWIEAEVWSRHDRWAAMSGADTIHVLLEDYASSVPEWLRERVTVIPNPATRPESTSPKKRPYKTILSLGRLVAYKQVDILIQAFAKISNEAPDWQLEIWGEGEAKASLKLFAESLGISNRVHFFGYTSEPHDVFCGADIFCIPSKFEGFSLTTVEAMSNAVPVVGFACCAGPRNLIIDGECGRLVPEMTVDALASTLLELTQSESIRVRMGENGRIMTQQFAPEKVFDQWEALICSTVLKSRQMGTALSKLDALEQSPLKELIHLGEIISREHIRTGSDASRLRQILKKYKFLRDVLHRARSLKYTNFLSFTRKFK